MTSARSDRGDQQLSGRRPVGLTMTRWVKEQLLEAAAVLDRSAGEWVLAATAEHGRALQDALGAVEVSRQPRVEGAVFTALDLTADERDELDDQAVACGLNRSAFVTSVSRLALGEELEAVMATLVTPADASG